MGKQMQSRKVSFISSYYSSKAYFHLIFYNIQVNQDYYLQSAIISPLSLFDPPRLLLQFIKLLYQFVSIMSSSILFPTNEYATSSKSSQQIQKLIIPFFQTIEQTLAYIISKGLPSQMPFLYKQMHVAHRVTLPFVCSKAPAEEMENQIIIAKSLRTLLEDYHRDLTAEEIEKIFETSLECLNNLHSPSNEEMGAVLEAAIKNHPDNRKLIKRLEEAALDLGRPNQPIISKVTSGRLISILAKYMGRMIKGQMIDILKRILADSEIEAKKVWVSEIFPRLLQNLELEFIELHLQEKIYESVWDQNEEIGILALEVILKNATRFSIEEQSSRIVKLFIDSLTSKKEKIALMASELMGEAYEKLLNIILKNQNNCIRFWKSLIEISQSKNQRVINNLAYNLPGILLLSSSLYKVDPVCDVYVELFYQPVTNKLLLSSYFHEIAKLFPNKFNDLKEVVYWMFNELFEEEDPYEQAIRILNKIIQHLFDCKHLFLVEPTCVAQDKDKGDDKGNKYFENIFCEYYIKYLTILLNKKNSSWLNIFYQSIKDCRECFSPQFIELTLLPKLYSCLRIKTPSMDIVVQTLVILASRDSNPALINAYASKINVQLSKSSKSYERETALLFFYYSTHYFSIDLFQQYRLGEKYLYFNNDKSFRVRATFIKNLPRLIYFFTKQEKIENAIILSRLHKDSDPQIQLLMQHTNFTEDDIMRQLIMDSSRRMKQKEKEKQTNLALRKQQVQIRRSSKELKKEDVLKKRIQTTKSKTKMLIKQIPKKKVAPVLVKTSSNINFRKNS